MINKLDKSDQRANEVLDETFDLFVSLDANEDQLDFPVLYASGRSGWADLDIDGPRKNLNPLFDTILEIVVTNLSYDVSFIKFISGSNFIIHLSGLSFSGNPLKLPSHDP